MVDAHELTAGLRVMVNLQLRSLKLIFNHSGALKINQFSFFFAVYVSLNGLVHFSFAFELCARTNYFSCNKINTVITVVQKYILHVKFLLLGSGYGHELHKKPLIK